MADLTTDTEIDDLMQATTLAGIRTAAGATTVGANIFTLTNPSAVTWIRMNADNTVTALSAANTLTALGVTALGTTTPGTGVTTFLATPSGANLASALTTALPDTKGGTGLTALGTGVATFLGTPSSANLRSALTDETGTGAAVFANTPTLVTPVLGVATATSVAVDDEAYDEAGWNGDLTVPTKNAVRDKIEALAVGNFDEDGDYTLTGTWAFDAATVTFGTITAMTVTTLTVSTVAPAADATTPLGDATHRFTTLYLSSGIELGHASDTTLTRSGSGDMAIEGNVVYRAGGTDVPVTDGGTGRSTSTTAYGLIAAGTTATGAHQTLAAGATTEILVGGGASALPVWTTAQGSGAPVRATSPTLTTPNIGTPSAGVLTNCTGLPAASIVAGVLAGNLTLGESAGQIVLDTTLSADGTWSGIMMPGTAGATLAFGDVVYFQASDSRWELTDADAEATSGPLLIGMCVLAAASDGDPTNILLYGKVRADANFPTLTIGAPAYISTTPGDIQVAQPSGTDDVIRVVGHALTADALLFNPSQDWMVHT